MINYSGLNLAKMQTDRQRQSIKQTHLGYMTYGMYLPEKPGSDNDITPFRMSVQNEIPIRSHLHERMME